MASFPFFIEKPTKTPGAALPISSVLLAACMCLERQIKRRVSPLKESCGVFLWLEWSSGTCHLAGPGRSDGLSPGLPHVSSRCQHRTMQLPLAARLGHGSLWPSSMALCRRAGVSASLSARFVFLISFYLKVYQLLYYQAELSLQSLRLSSSFPFFVSLDNHCLWSQLPLLIFHYSLI